jgi:hypothetical protein
VLVGVHLHSLFPGGDDDSCGDTFVTCSDLCSSHNRPTLSWQVFDFMHPEDHSRPDLSHPNPLRISICYPDVMVQTTQLPIIMGCHCLGCFSLLFRKCILGYVWYGHHVTGFRLSSFGYDTGSSPRH